MAKKKGKRRMKKQVRKTLGALFLASAVAVAAIPTGSYDGGSASAENTGEYFVHEVKTGYHDGDNTVHSMQYGENFKNGNNISELRSVWSDSSQIPHCDDGSDPAYPAVTIYSSTGGKFQFAYVDADGHQVGTDRFAVILGYNQLATNALDGNRLEIEDTLDAYLNYNENVGGGVPCAVGRKGNFLYYESSVTEKGSGTTDYTGQNYYIQKVVEEVQDKDGFENLLYQSSVDGSLVPDGYGLTESALKDYCEEHNLAYVPKAYMVKKTVEYVHVFTPCYDEQMSTWENANLYFYPTDDWKSSGTTLPEFDKPEYKDDDGRLIPQIANADHNNEYSRIIAPVYYIGKQCVKSAGNGKYSIDTDITDANGPSKGIFAGQTNIKELVTHDNLRGVSDYAFYASGVTSIQLGIKTDTLGNHAFDSCKGLITIDLQNSNLKTIGAYCFYNCANLSEFKLPDSVAAIGDGAFRNCESMTNIELIAQDAQGNQVGNLSELGAYVFQGCNSLQSLTFPKSYGESIELSEFEGCRSLQWIKSENNQFNIVSSKSCNYDWQAFQNECNDYSEAEIEARNKFYIEAPNTVASALKKTCTENEIAFKHFGEEVYELTKKEETASGNAATVTYTVDSAGTLTKATRNDDNYEKIVSIAFPKYIGPYTIKKIGDETFKNWCTLTEVTIPATISEIGQSAFQGCHNLEYVFFENVSVRIGDKAFWTQQVSNHDTKCDQDMNVSATDNNPKVKLNFVGSGETIDANAGPFSYAMNKDNYYTSTSQKKNYILYLSGWPNLQTVQYHYDDLNDIGYSELVDFPTLGDSSKYLAAEYLTDEQKDAIKTVAVSADASESFTPLQSEYYKAATTLVIPNGIEAIEDGLYVSKTEGYTTRRLPVVCNGLTRIETNYEMKGDKILYFENMSDDTSLGKTEDELSEDEKRNYFPRADAARSDFAFATALSEISITGDTTTIDPYAFQGDTNLTKVDISGPVKEIGEYAFQGDSQLTDVSISSTSLSSLGTAPFKGCSELATVRMNGSDHFASEKSIIYKVNDGVKTGIIEVLPGRSDAIHSGDLDTNITSVAQEAFTDTVMREVDLTGTGITTIPTHAFYETSASSTSVKLPNTCNTIETYAFEKSKVSKIAARNIFAPDAEMLDGIIVNGGTTKAANPPDAKLNGQVTVNAPEDSQLYNYAVKYAYLVDTNMDKEQYTVTFYGYNPGTGERDQVLYSVSVDEGDHVDESALYTARQKAKENGAEKYDAEIANSYYELTDYWRESKTQSRMTDSDVTGLEIDGNYNFTAEYNLVAGEITKHTVRFEDYYGNILSDYVYEDVIDGYTLAQHHYQIPTLPNVTVYGQELEFVTWKTSREGLTVTSPITSDVTFEPSYNEVDSGVYTVEFWYVNPVTGVFTEHDKQTNILKGTNLSKRVTDPDPITGYTFNGWDKASVSGLYGDTEDGVYDITNVTANLKVVGSFSPNSSSGSSGDSGDSSSSSNSDGSSASESSSSSKPGGGSNDLVQINGFEIPAYDTDIFAVALYYAADGKPYSYRLVNIGSKAPDVAKPEGYTSGYAWSPTPTETTVNDVSFFNLVPYTPSNTGTSTTATPAEFYSLTVVNGSGSGSYVAGKQIVIAANDPASGQEFSNWTIEPSETAIASKAMSATTITMPSENVTVTAHYKARTSSSTSSGSTTNNSGRATNTGTVSGGTTVVIDKNGLSNTGVVSATVRGSSDNFTIKIKESTDASTAIVKALQNEYGDISGIKYFPMDISLYDATGTKKITDTTGLSISITLPIPDSLIPYAGNNKVAGVVNNRLDKLSPKFTTIDKVACMTFTAEHFSPYVIYVDTNNATANSQIIADNTPKTGDGIHPKWFLSIGLACISMVLFLKKDKKTAKLTTA